MRFFILAYLLFLESCARSIPSSSGPDPTSPCEGTIEITLSPIFSEEEL